MVKTTYTDPLGVQRTWESAERTVRPVSCYSTSFRSLRSHCQYPSHTHPGSHSGLPRLEGHLGDKPSSGLRSSPIKALRLGPELVGPCSWSRVINPGIAQLRIGRHRTLTCMILYILHIVQAKSSNEKNSIEASFNQWSTLSYLLLTAFS